MTAGGNGPIPSGIINIRVVSGNAADVSAFRLYENLKVSNDSDMIFYGQKNSDDNTVQLLSEGAVTLFSVDLPKLNSLVQKVAFSITCDDGKNIASLGKLSIQVEHQNEVLLIGEVDVTSRSEAALILGEVYRRNNEWKFRFVSQGFNGGLKPLAEHFGVEVADNPPPAPKPAAAPPPHASKPISLSKISLTKESPKVSLAKRNSFGLIKINLNWNNAPSPQGFFASLKGGTGAIDLDLGCFIRLKNGDKLVVQALGKNFGSLNSEPYIQLQDDDRTGQSQDGEWLHINGAHWDKIDEVLIFAFIYEGVANWAKTNGSVTIHIPNEAPVETLLTEGSANKNMCGIAKIINQNGSMHLERINRYVSGHKELDESENWGFRWKAGSK